MIRWHVIKAVFKRNVMSYFSGLLGYLFIIVFVVASAYFAFQPEFFTDNRPTLDHLTAIFPWLLLFIVPAIAMASWAEERRSGTDELLFTLPGTDTEILLGKYLAVATIYTVALVFSITQLLVLNWLSAKVDWGVIFTTYLGYWLAGCSLLSAGMLASSLTKSTPVAFVLGSVLCVIPVGISSIDTSSDLLRSLTVAENLRDFAVGLVSIPNVMYFVTLAVVCLYLNFIVISHRHWSAIDSRKMGLMYSLRTVSILATFLSLTYISAYAFQPSDFSKEGLYTVSSTTRSLIDNLDRERPVEIQAFLSPEVPREYIDTSKTLRSLLGQLDTLGGDKISVRVVEVAPFDPKSDEAEILGIRPVTLQREIDGRVKTIDVFLGAIVTSSYDQVVIPFFGKGLPLEYELTRAIGTVSREKRLKIGILKTDAQLAQDSERGREQEWQLTQMLRMHYDVTSVDPFDPIPENNFDVLLAVMPSSLTQEEMTNFVEYVRKGKPVLIFDDPLPFFMGRMMPTGQRIVTSAPKLPKPSPGGNMGMMMGMNRQQAPPKADQGKASALLDTLQIAWEFDEVVWDQFNPHLEFNIGGEFVFVSRENGTRGAFNEESPITSGMQELLVAYAGSVQPRSNMNKDRKFTPLLRTSVESTLLDWGDFTSQSFDPFSFTPAISLKPVTSPKLDDYAHVVGAKIEEPGLVNAIFVADIDMISDWFFVQREQGGLPLEFDNVSFVMNCVDALAEDETYLELRKRRPEMRTLTRLQRERDDFIKERNAEERKAEDDAKDQLKAASARFEEQRKEIEDNKSLDEQTKMRMLESVVEAEKRRVQVAEANIEREKNNTIKLINRRMERKIRDVEEDARYKAILFSPLPAVILGLAMMLSILMSEKKNVAPERAVR